MAHSGSLLIPASTVSLILVVPRHRILTRRALLCIRYPQLRDLFVASCSRHVLHQGTVHRKWITSEGNVDAPHEYPDTDRGRMWSREWTTLEWEMKAHGAEWINVLKVCAVA